MGLALNLEANTLGAVLFSSSFADAGLTEGSLVRTSGKIANIDVSDGFRGRLVNALGRPLDGSGGFEGAGISRTVESKAPGIMDRRSVHEPFSTGVTAVDAMIPIGRGQRELIIGDRQTGKTTVAVDAIINQDEVLCVYVAIGQKMSTVAEMIKSLGESMNLTSVIVVLSAADEASTLQFLAPYTGATIAEHSMYSGTPT